MTLTNQADQDSSDRQSERNERSNWKVKSLHRYDAPRVEKREKLADVTAGIFRSGAPT
jgi:hypothetical protein